MMGLAPDGGLFVPERIPQADMAEVERLAGESYAAMAGYLAGLFFGDDFDPQLLRRELESLYDFIVLWFYCSTTRAPAFDTRPA